MCQRRYTIWRENHIFKRHKRSCHASLNRPCTTAIRSARVCNADLLTHVDIIIMFSQKDVKYATRGLYWNPSGVILYINILSISSMWRWINRGRYRELNLDSQPPHWKAWFIRFISLISFSFKIENFRSSECVKNSSACPITLDLNCLLRVTFSELSFLQKTQE